MGKSKDKLKSDKFQDLDIFSKTKTPVTLYQQHRLPGATPKSGSTTPVSAKTEKQVDFTRKLSDSLDKVERKNSEEREKSYKSDFKKPGKVEDRRRSSNSSDKGRDKEKDMKDKKEEAKDRHRSSSSSRDKHRSDKDKKNVKEEKKGGEEDKKEIVKEPSKVNDKYEKE